MRYKLIICLVVTFFLLSPVIAGPFQTNISFENVGFEDGHNHKKPATIYFYQDGGAITPTPLGWNSSLRMGESVTTTAVADINMDGRDEILIGTNFISNYFDLNATLLVLNGSTGELLWSAFFPNCSITKIAFGNLTGNSEMDIVVATGMNLITFSTNTAKTRGIFAFNSTGNLLWSFNTTGSFFSGPNLVNTTMPVLGMDVGDLDGNGLDDVVASLYNSTVLAINGTNGNLIWKIIYQANQMYWNDEIPGDVVVSDVNNDGKNEAVIVFANLTAFYGIDVPPGTLVNITSYGWVRLLNGTNGNTIWKTDVGVYDIFFKSIMRYPGTNLIVGDFLTKTDKKSIAVAAQTSLLNISDEESLTNMSITILDATGAVKSRVTFYNESIYGLTTGSLVNFNVEDIIATIGPVFGYPGLEGKVVALNGSDLSILWTANGTVGFAMPQAAEFMPMIPKTTPTPPVDEVLISKFSYFNPGVGVVAYNGTQIWERGLGASGIIMYLLKGDFNGDGYIDFAMAASSFTLFYGTPDYTIYASFAFVTAERFAELKPLRPVLKDNVTISFELNNELSALDLNITFGVYNSTFDMQTGLSIGNLLDSFNVTISKESKVVVDWTFNTTLLGAGTWNIIIVGNKLSSISTYITIPIESPYVSTTTTDSQEAINKALQWLIEAQNDDGAWSFRGGQGVPQASSAAITGLAVLAFINNGTNTTILNTVVKRAVNWIISVAQPNGSIYGPEFSETQVYETTMALLGLIAYNRTLTTYNATICDVIKNAREFLVAYQNDEDFPTHPYSVTNAYYGGWGYPGHEGDLSEEHADLSNTQWALMALWAAGLPSNNETWSKAEIFVTRCLNNYTLNPDYSYNNDGGFTYNNMYGSYGSMVGAGIWSLLLINESYRNNDSRILSALDWLEDNFAVDRNPRVENWGGFWMGGYTTFLYYYYLSLGKALAMLNDPNYDQYYYDMQDYVLSDIRVNDSGTWFWNNSLGGEPAEYATVQAILFLQIKGNATGELANLTFILHSAADLHIYDPLGRHIGYNYSTGQVDLIEGAYYSGLGTEPQIIKITNVIKGEYKVVLVGVAQGNATLKILGENKYGKQVINQTQPQIKVEPNNLYELEAEIVTFVGEEVITTSYKSVVATISVTAPVVVYDNEEQTIDIINVVATCSNFYHDELNESEAILHDFKVLFENGTETKVSGTLSYNGTHWNVYNVSVASLPEGTYKVAVTFNDTDASAVTVYSNTFTIEHFITITLPTISFDNETKLLNITGIVATCSYTAHGTLNDSIATKYTYAILTSDGSDTGIGGNLEWNGTHWNAYNVNVSSLSAGTYKIKIVFEDPDASKVVIVENAFEIEEVAPPPPPPPPEDYTWLYILAGIIILAIVIAIFAKKRKS